MRLDASSDNFKEDMRLMCAMCKIPEPRRTLYLATCARCCPKLRSYGWELSRFGDTRLRLADLNPHCIVCDVIHQAHRLFSTGDFKPNLVCINHGCTAIKNGALQGDHFPADLLLIDHLAVEFAFFSGDTNKPHIQLPQVQLYSEGTQVYIAYCQIFSEGVSERSAWQYPLIVSVAEGNMKVPEVATLTLANFALYLFPIEFFKTVSKLLTFTGPQNFRNPFPVSSFEICPEPLTSPMASKIRGWIDECTEFHNECIEYSTNKAFVPKRLINLKGRCRLESAESPVRYAALSYCWGPIEQPSTTKSNVALRYKEFQYRELPQTLQDAILVTRMLGLDYLWIDAVCIVQDDRDEWASEAAKMGDIYSMAHVVLAATAANSATEGFLRPRDRLQKITSLVDPENLFTINARVVDTHDKNNRDTQLEKQPLSKRGWALQERALACRTVHFLRDEVFFECKSSAICECGHHHSDRPDDRTYRITNVEYDEFNVHTWILLVKDFTKRSLTQPDDALPALSGIARSKLPLNPGRYFAGIWERDIACQLGWFVKPHPLVTGDRTKKPQPRPTFAWATFPGPVSFDFMFEPLCTLHGGSVVPLAGDTYGQVKEACIQMYGQTLRGRDLVGIIENLIHTRDDDSQFYDRVIIQIDGMHSVSLAPYSNDPTGVLYEGLETACDWDAVLCFALGTGYNEEVLMLILQEVSGEDVFERIGVVRRFPYDLMDKLGPERIVTIV